MSLRYLMLMTQKEVEYYLPLNVSNFGRLCRSSSSRK